MNEETSPTTISWYALNTNQALQQLDVDPAVGLAAAAVEARLQRFGPNALVERGGKKPWHILWEQLTGTLVVILIIAAVLTPPDVFSLLIMSAPLMLLYELCILLIRWSEKRREARAPAEEPAAVRTDADPGEG